MQQINPSVLLLTPVMDNLFNKQKITGAKLKRKIGALVF